MEQLEVPGGFMVFPKRSGGWGHLLGLFQGHEARDVRHGQGHEFPQRQVEASSVLWLREAKSLSPRSPKTTGTIPTKPQCWSVPGAALTQQQLLDLLQLLQRAPMQAPSVQLVESEGRPAV